MKRQLNEVLPATRDYDTGPGSIAEQRNPGAISKFVSHYGGRIALSAATIALPFMLWSKVMDIFHSDTVPAASAGAPAHEGQPPASHNEVIINTFQDGKPYLGQVAIRIDGDATVYSTNTSSWENPAPPNEAVVELPEGTDEIEAAGVLHNPPYTYQYTPWSDASSVVIPSQSSSPPMEVLTIYLPDNYPGTY